MGGIAIAVYLPQVHQAIRPHKSTDRQTDDHVTKPSRTDCIFTRATIGSLQFK